MGWPSAWRPAGARAFVTTYGASHANGRAAAEALGLTAPELKHPGTEAAAGRHPPLPPGVPHVSLNAFK